MLCQSMWSDHQRATDTGVKCSIAAYRIVSSRDYAIPEDVHLLRVSTICAFWRSHIMSVLFLATNCTGKQTLGNFTQNIVWLWFCQHCGKRLLLHRGFDAGSRLDYLELGFFLLKYMMGPVDSGRNVAWVQILHNQNVNLKQKQSTIC